jgi:YesN/AraC family two-component response regulator
MGPHEMPLISTILVDDDRMAMEYLEERINWELYGFRVVGRAIDGDNAITLCNKLSPQLVISDVRMPSMNGIEMAEEIRKTNKDVHIIFLSGYKDFEYVLSAMHLGVDDYLLKHELDEKMLLSKLIPIKQLIRAKEFNIENTFGKIVYDILQDNYTPDRNIEKDIQRMLDLSYQVMLIGVDNCLLQNGGKSQHTQHNELLLETINSTLNEFNIKGIPVKIQKNKFLLLLNLNNYTVSSRVRNDMLKYATRLQSKLRDHSGLSSSMLLMPSACKLEQMKEIYMSWVEMMSFCRINNSSFSFFFDDMPKLCQEKSQIDIKDIEAALDEGDDKTLSRSLNEKFQELLNSKDIRGVEVFCQMCLELLSQKGEKTLNIQTGEEFKILSTCENEEFMTWQGIAGWVSTQLQDLCKVIRDNKFLHYPKIVLKAIEFIQQNYQRNDLSVEDIARYVGKKRNYLSHIFRSITGVAVADYITRVRIQKSLCLIEDDKHKIYEISGMVGYNTSQYFSTVFKKLMGMTPYEYKRGNENADQETNSNCAGLAN